MKKKVLFAAMLAVVLVFGFVVVSCDTGGGTEKRTPVIPEELQGIYKAESAEEGNTYSYTMRIYATGKGTINGTPCNFSLNENVITITMGSDTITLNYSVKATGIDFSNVENKPGVLYTVLTKFDEKSPIEREIPELDIIPTELAHVWGDSVGFLLDIDGNKTSFTHPIVFEINSDGTGKTIHTFYNTPVECKWRVNGNKLTLIFMTESCTFDYVIDASGLKLSNPVPPSSALADYVDFTAMKIVSAAPSVNKVNWDKTFDTSYAGIWYSSQTATSGLPVFKIKSDGNGQVYSGSIGGYVTCTYRSGPGSKILLDVPGFGSSMYDASIASGKLSLEKPVLATDASPALAGYDPTFGPFVQLPIDDLEWENTIPSKYVGAWEAFGVTWFTINGDRSGTVTVSNFPFQCTYSFANDGTNDKLLLNLNNFLCMFDVSIVTDQLFLSNPIPDDGLLAAYAFAFGLDKVSP